MFPIVRARRDNFAHYSRCLPDRFGADREAIRRALESENIESRPLWKPMHLQPVFRGFPAAGGRVAEGLFDRGLCLPSGSALTAGDRDRIVDLVLRTRKRVGAAPAGEPR